MTCTAGILRCLKGFLSLKSIKKSSSGKTYKVWKARSTGCNIGVSRHDSLSCWDTIFDLFGNLITVDLSKSFIIQFQLKQCELAFPNNVSYIDI